MIRDTYGVANAIGMSQNTGTHGRTFNSQVFQPCQGEKKTRPYLDRDDGVEHSTRAQTGERINCQRVLHKQNRKVNIGDVGKEVLEKIDENNSTIQQFRRYAAELDEKHDRFERITKMSRDIVIESKRIIFLLHSIETPSKREVILNQAKTRLNNLRCTVFKVIAMELKNQDAYHYIKAYRAGLEEYTEAVTFHQYLTDGSIQDWVDLQSSFTYKPPNCHRRHRHLTGSPTKPREYEDGVRGGRKVESIGDDECECESEDKDEYKEEDDEKENGKIWTLITPYYYVLGLGDLTGELMRKCISNLAIGDIDSCYQICNFVRNVYNGFLGCSNLSNKEISRKLQTLRQNLHKIEYVCYMFKIRGIETPKQLLADAAIIAIEGCNETYDVP